MKALETKSVVSDGKSSLHTGTYDLGPITEDAHRTLLKSGQGTLLGKDVTLTDGQKVGKVTGLARIPSSLDKAYADRLVVTIVWKTVNLQKLAGQAELKIDPMRGLVVLQGELS